MNRIGRALWFIESRLGSSCSLDEIAASAALSKHHLARAFANATGMPVARYVRARRLSEAARRLSEGGGDVLGLALEHGYGSHEAFTRAFVRQFGRTPAQVRRDGPASALVLQAPITIEAAPSTAAETVRFEERAGMRIVGLEKRYGQETLGAIPTLWNRFVEIESAIAGRVDAFSYGVCRGGLEEHVVYLAGVEVRADHAVPADLDTVEVPPARYAVVPHRGHVAELRGLWRWILETWLPQSGLRLAPQPDLERYGPGFDPDTGMGDIEVWVPVERAAGHAH